MNSKTSPTLVGNWNISRARDNSSAIETTTLSITPDTAGNQVLDGVSPVPGGADMIFTGTASADFTAWTGTASLPATNPTPFIFVLSADGSSLGGSVIEPNTNQTTAWVGERI